MKVIKNVRLYGSITDITVDNGKIVSIGLTDEPGVDFGGNKIYPGLIDIHSHGCIGYDTMEGNIDKMADWELSQGVTTWYPTTMTMSREDVVKATSEPIDFGHGANIPGFHLEGPFINVKYKGAQNEKFIVPPSMDFVNECKNVAIITLAPEVDGAIDFIKECPYVVALGHTDTDYDTAVKAFEAGAKCLTHTYNAMPGIHHRKPGPIGAGSDCEGVYAQLICDGTHVHPSAVKMLIKIFGTDRICLISDSLNATGLAEGRYMFGGQEILVKNGVARVGDENGPIAGAITSLFGCVKCAIKFGIPEEDAVKMASLNPAKLMGLNKGVIAEGYDADFIIVDDDFNLVKSIARGEF